MERELRDLARRQGYTADRIPLSGAAQGFKGDVRISKDGEEYRVEVKARKEDFKRLYELLARFKKETGSEQMQIVIDGTLVALSAHLDLALEGGGIFIFAEHLPYFEEFKKTFRKIGNLQKLVGESDVLAVKDDRKGFLFLRYRD